ncbi:MAG TPA: Hsp33 family molecular chaperone HslO, partial [Myxococcota bacterium]|nr:Hsp33 family molecular chaperone HslO [Myxococcota bacterium]
RVLRAVTYDGAFRVIAVRTTDLVREAMRVHRNLVAPDEQGNGDARNFADLLTGAILVRETMAPGQRLQAVLSRQGVGQIVVDSRPGEGSSAPVRGLVNRQSALAEPILGGDAVLRVTRTLPRGRMHQSIVEAQANGMSQALMHYMQTSEQVVSMLGLGTVFDGERVVASGGYLVQLLPECTDGPLSVMTERLAHDFADFDRFILAHDADAVKLKDELLYGFDHEVLADEGLRYACDCSEERVLGAVATLGRDEIAQIVETGEIVSLTCEYCRTDWTLGTDRLKTLLVSN